MGYPIAFIGPKIGWSKFTIPVLTVVASQPSEGIYQVRNIIIGLSHQKKRMPRLIRKSEPQITVLGKKPFSQCVIAFMRWAGGAKRSKTPFLIITPFPHAQEPFRNCYKIKFLYSEVNFRGLKQDGVENEPLTSPFCSLQLRSEENAVFSMYPLIFGTIKT